MKNEIQKKLSQIERANKIKILFACESGSRGWEFPSPDSDYDVRFIYTKAFEEYISIKEKTDHLSFPINNDLDIYGWDLRKVLQLIYKSNTTPFEWLQSPIIYREEKDFKQSLWELCPHYFNQRSNIHHYIGIAKGAMGSLDEDGFIKIKKLFYVLRPLLAALWCYNKNTIAPMSIKPLMDLLSDELKAEIKDLIQLKESVEEGFLIKPSVQLVAWIDETFQYCSSITEVLERPSFDLNRLDDFFVKTIQHDYTVSQR